MFQVQWRVGSACTQCHRVSSDRGLVRMWRLYDFTCHLAFSLKTNPADDLIAALTQRNYQHSSLSGSEAWVWKCSCFMWCCLLSGHWDRQGSFSSSDWHAALLGSQVALPLTSFLGWQARHCFTSFSFCLWSLNVFFFWEPGARTSFWCSGIVSDIIALLREVGEFWKEPGKHWTGWYCFYVQCAPGLAQHDSLPHGPASAQCVSPSLVAHEWSSYSFDFSVGFLLARAGSPVDFNIMLKGIFVLQKELS